MKKHLKSILFILILSMLFKSCSEDSLNDSCGCKKEWKEKLKNSNIDSHGKDFNVKASGNNIKDYISNNEKIWNEIDADRFLNLIGGKKFNQIIADSNPPGYEVAIGNDIIWIYADKTAYSTDYVLYFNWRFSDNTLYFYRERNGITFNIGKLTIQSGRPIFIESLENQKQRGLLEDQLPSQVVDFCACKCDIMEKGFSSELAIDSCFKKHLIKPRGLDEVNQPWGEVKSVLNYY